MTWTVQRSCLAAALALAVSPAGAQAQAAGGLAARMQTFTTSAFYQELLRRAMTAMPPEVFQRCPTLVSNGSTVKALRPIVFGADGFPTTGAWKQSFPVSGCGDDKTLNLYFLVTPERKINTVIGAPGDTLADPVLQRDGARYAQNTIQQVGGGACLTPQIRNTHFDGYDPAQAPDPTRGAAVAAIPWRETWTMAGCGKVYDVSMQFFPRVVGTTIVAYKARPHP